MQFTQEMMLHSDSGYCMPFEERDKDVEMTLGYGKQRHPKTNETFFHHGTDFKAPHYMLSAISTGKVTGMGNDSVHGIYQIIRYGDYEVNYGHLSNVFVNYGQSVKAGQIVAVTANLLHIEVRYKGQELNPLEFLTMLYGNLKAVEKQGKVGMPEFVTIDMDVHTIYDKDQDEIEDLMMRFLPTYLSDMQEGLYLVPEHTEQALRNIFTMSAMKNYFYETLPSMANPLGMTSRSLPLAEKVQNLLSSGLIDPPAELDFDIQSFDISRIVSVYPDRSGIRWWTKAWFNNSEKGEAAIEIDRQLAIKFINDNIEKDDWLEEYFPKQMEVYHNAIEQTREQILSQLNI